MFPRLLAAVPLLATLPAQAATVTTPSIVRTRAVWFVEQENPIGAEVGFAYCTTRTNDAPAPAIVDAAPGNRVAFGGEAWAALETFTDLRFGPVTVKAGNYYAVLERGKDGWLLGLLDPDAVRKAQLPPGIAKNTALAAAVPLAASERPDAGLHAAWEAGAQPGTIALVLGIGTQALRATATVEGAGKGEPLLFPDARGASRITFGPADATKVACAIVDHGVVAWSDALAAQARALPIGRRWRLGRDWATTLDTNVPLVLGGKKVAAGSWHLTLARSRSGWQLVLSSAAADHRARIDGFGADLAQAVVEVPLQASPGSSAAERLQITFVSDGGKHELVLAFGPERHAVPLAPGR